ncbi:MAG: nickel-dependent hydrogenase large subunit [Paracoccaceae bacterium]
MSGPKLVVGPFNRVEGDLEIHLDTDAGAVTAAYVNSPLYRGFERMLEGKNPMDALTLTPRICGICSISQSAAAARALASAMGLTPSPDGERIAALIHMVENISDHMTHFHLFFMPDFTRAVYAHKPWYAQAIKRFTTMQGSAQRHAIEARAQLMHILGMLAGKWPHTLAIQPGGATKAPSASDKVRIMSTLRAHRRFLEQELFGARIEDFAALTTFDQLQNWAGGDAALFLDIAADLDLAGMGRGAGRYLSFGAYPVAGTHIFAAGMDDGTTATNVAANAVANATTNAAPQPLDLTTLQEDLSHAWMLGDTAHPAHGQTTPDEDMRPDAYTWCKAPRLLGQTWETGALARQVIDRHPLALALRDTGVLGRVAARLLETARTQIEMEKLAQSIAPDAQFMVQGKMPATATGIGLVEAARGALGHWISVDQGRIKSYQIIAPTTWNFSPRDGAGTPGPVESALVGAAVQPGEDTPVAVQHIVRSFDPCMVCTVH